MSVEEGRPDRAERLRRVADLLAGALDVPAASRPAFLDEACAGDVELRAELESLLAAHEGPGLLDRPVVPTSGDVAAAHVETQAGTIISHFEILECAGTGGMGVVYRARDLRLDRVVALKFLSPALGHDAPAKQRFQIEARAAAALDHPNVCAIHEIGETPDGQLFIAMAFVDGPSLRQLIREGPLPVGRAIDVASQIAAALERAHGRGIVHRDIKPANVMVGTDGVVKLVDFGVAKLTGPALTGAEARPGTMAYMSPEQVRGEEVDARTDLWSLGIVLYEMLAGRRPFTGAADAAFHAIQHDEPPPLGTLRPDLPIRLEQIVARALDKDRGRRFASATEMRAALRGLSVVTLPQPWEIGEAKPSSHEASTPLGAGGSGRSQRWRGGLRVRPWLAIAAAIGLLAAGVMAFLRFGPTPVLSPEILRLSISASGMITPQLSAAISPDGRQVAFVTTDASGDSRIWVRPLDQLEARPLAGTERAAHPFWSPDGRSLGFVADGRLKRIDLASGSVRTLADTAIRYGGTWGPDGTILFSLRANELAAVPAAGGPITTVLKTDSATRQSRLAWPRFLPNGRDFLFYAWGREAEDNGIYVGSLDARDTKLLLRNDLRAWYSPPGFLVFGRDETLMAQRFDLARLELVGEPAVIADGVWIARGAAQASFSVSENGALAYVNASIWDGELAWFDRSGRPLGSAGPPVRYEGTTPEISPDGRWVAVARGELGREDIWVLGTAGEAATRLTFSPEAEVRAVWDADGRRVTFVSGSRLIVKDVDSGAEQVLVDSISGYVTDQSRDGRFVLLHRFLTPVQLWTLDLDGDAVPRPFLDPPVGYNVTQAQLSPDGRWVAYTSNESGRDEVYVQSFPVPGNKRRVSSAGGAMPRWRGDGQELFFLAGNQFMTATPIIDAASLELGTPMPLFRTRLVVEGSESDYLPAKYDVAPDGQRFLLRYLPVDPGPPITVVINWLAGLGR